MARGVLKSSLMAAAFGVIAGCAAHVHGAATVHTPSLVVIGPGIWVVEDYPEPVFYADSYYWWWSGGLWYRSGIHTGSWVRVRASVVPIQVRRVDRPRRYIHYRGRGEARRRRGPPGHRGRVHQDRGRRGPPDHARGRGHGRGRRR